MKICYVEKKFSTEHANIIEHANSICEEYYDQGLVLTLRQLYYQFVARDLLLNDQSQYNRLGNIIRDARRAGQLDWSFIIDRTRNEMSIPHYANPGELLERAAASYHTDLWKGQGVRPVVFVEKDAAIGVIEGVCNANDIAYLSCRGYTSDSELWSAAQRIRDNIHGGDRVVILHIGDHDPSGLDMTRDIYERISMFLYKDWAITYGASLPRPLTRGAIKRHMLDTMQEKNSDITRWGEPFSIKRIALNYDQVQQYEPPPNPAKTTDARFAKYFADTGLEDSWELDALEPNILINLIQNEIDLVRNDDKYETAVGEMERDQLILGKISKHYQPVVGFLDNYVAVAIEGRGVNE